LKEERQREATRNTERLARERALAEKRRMEDEARARDRWAHMIEMLPILQQPYHPQQISRCKS
jgi:hypothetical protein